MKQKNCGLAREKKNNQWTTPHIRGLQQRHIENVCKKGDNERECNMVSMIICQYWIQKCVTHHSLSLL
jgi:hypothetical protein